MSAPQIQAIFYNNPDIYPPIINSTHLLAGAGYEVTLLCRDSDRRWDIAYPAGSTVVRVPGSRRSSWKEYLGFVKTVWRMARPDAAIFIGHDMHGFLPARLLATRYRRPLVYHCHDYADNSQSLAVGSRVVRRFERLWARTADIVIVPDSQRGEFIARELRLTRPPLIVANAPIRPFTGNGERLFQALANQDKRCTKILLRQGRIGPGHAIEQTIRSLPKWTDPNWGFVIMGAGGQDYCMFLQQVSTELRVTNRFAILPAVAYDEIGQFTPGASMGSALYEPIHINNLHITTASNKLLEYMAAGVPVLASDRPGLKEFVAEYGCGVVADESSPDSIAMAVNNVLSDSDWSKQMGQAGRRAFEDTFCYEKQFAPVLAAVDRLVSTP